MKKNGFTLIELLVTITIFGVITVMALPSVRQIQSNNKVKKYEAYSLSLQKAAKAYIDSYEEDVFLRGSDEVCGRITYQKLLDKKLIKPINISGLTCGKEGDTYVNVIKARKKYYYAVNIRCRNSAGNVEFESDYYETLDERACNSESGEDSVGPKIRLSFAKKKKVQVYSTKVTGGSNDLKMILKVEDLASGISTEADKLPVVQIHWTFIGVDNDGNEITENKTVVEEKRIGNPEELKGKDFVISLSEEITIPKEFQNKELNGRLLVMVTPINVQDSKGNKTLNPTSEKEIFLDSKPPKINVLLSKWADLNTKPNNETQNLEEYTNNTWLAGKVLTKVEAEDVAPPNVTNEKIISGVDMSSASYTTRGTTENDTNKKGIYRNIEAEGKSTIVYNVCDIAGNCTDSDTYTILLDRTKPNCTTISGGNTTWTNGPVTLTGTCNDTNGALDVSGCKQETVTKTYDSDSDEKDKYGAGEVEDNAGNVGMCTETQKLKIDKTPPTCKNSGGNTTWTKNNVTIKGTCVDEEGGSGCDPNNSTARQTYTSDINTSITGKVSPGVVRDKAGNEGNCPADRTVKIDKTPPTCTWNPYDMGENVLLKAAATVFIPYLCDDGNGSGCDPTSGDIKSGDIIDLCPTNAKYCRPYCYWFPWSVIGGQFLGIDLMDLDENYTANYLPLKDKVGNETDCPKVRPYNPSECKYTDGQLRSYKPNSLRGNQSYVLDDVKYRPQMWTNILSIGNLWDFGTLEATTANYSNGYRKYRKVGNNYELCLDISLDVMFENITDLKKANVVDELKYIKDNVRPGIVTKTHQGKY